MHQCKFFIKKVFILLLFVIYAGASCKDEPLKKPEDNRFTKVVLASNLDEPLQFEILDDERVLFVERKGKIRVFNPQTSQVTTIADIPVRHTFSGITAGGTNESEDGIQGVLLDPGFEKNQYIYVYYAPLEGSPRNELVRFKWNGDSINLSTKKKLLEVMVDTGVCCHVGGGMVFDNEKNLLLATGENAQAQDGFSTIDDRPGHINEDSQKSSANTNDLRGKIIRIHPEADGTYSIPKGNLFPPGTPKTRPEIYTMGNRNPWRLTIDRKTDWLYWGEVGPNGNVDNEKRGPRSYDEFNQARRAGNFGYPYFIANNQAYRKYDFVTGISGGKFNAVHPLNHSSNNTGMIELPPAISAFIYYPYAVSDKFPLLGSGGSSAVGGPVFRQSNFKKAARPFPAYYEGKWFITDWVRGWIMAVTMDKNGDYQSMERFFPEINLKGPIDMDFGPQGDLYVLEYGDGVFKGNASAQIVRIVYNGGNRPPVVQASADKTAGAVPLKVQLSAAGTKDYDNDKLNYEWKITGHEKTVQKFTQLNPLITLDKPGVYAATLTVKDAGGAKSSKTIKIVAGNEPPVVKFDFNGGNRSFFFSGKNIAYAVRVYDMEDGTVENKGIDTSKIKLHINYLPAGYDLSSVESSEEDIDPVAQFGIQLMNRSDCKSCHSVDAVSIGPALKIVAEKYRADKTAINRLAKKIITGGGGVWGEMMMPAHPAIPESDARAIVRYILRLGQEHAISKQSLHGKYITHIPEEEQRGSFMFKATYTDKGTPSAPSQTTTDLVVLRNPVVPVIRADELSGVQINRHVFYDMSDISPDSTGAYIRLNRIDLSGIKAIAFRTAILSPLSNGPGWNIEIRIDSATGKGIGKVAVKLSAQNGTDKTSPYITSNIEAINSEHDLYIVFITTETRNKKQLIKIRDIQFAQ